MVCINYVINSKLDFVLGVHATQLEYNLIFLVIVHKYCAYVLKLLPFPFTQEQICIAVKTCLTGFKQELMNLK